MRRHALLVVVIMLLCAAAGVLLAASIGRTVTATASIVVQDPANDSLSAALSTQTATSNPNYVPDQVAILQLPSTAESAARTWNAKHPTQQVTTSDVLAGLSVSSSATSDLIKVGFEDRDRHVAAGLADTTIAAYKTGRVNAAAASQASQLARVRRDLSAYSNLPAKTQRDPSVQDNRTALLGAESRLILQDPNANTGILSYSPAQVPPPPSRAAWVRWGLAGLLVGILPAAGIAYLVALRRRRFVDRYEPEALLDRPLLSEVPAFGIEHLRSALPVLERPTSAAAEAFRFAASALSLRESTRGSRMFGVVSANPGDGKTAVTANLALAAARDGRRVLVIDADLQGQTLTTRLLEEAAVLPGLAQMLDGTADYHEAVRRVDLGNGARVDLLPGGVAEPESSEVISGVAFGALLRALRERYDLIIVDTAPALQVAYASTVLKQLEQVIAVVRHNSSAAGVEELDERMRFLNVVIAGYVYTHAPLRRGLGQYSAYVAPEPHRPRPSATKLPKTPKSPRTPESEASAENAPRHGDLIDDLMDEQDDDPSTASSTRL